MTAYPPEWFTGAEEAEARAERDMPMPLAQAVGERAAAHPQAQPEDEPEPGEYDPGPEVDDEGGMSEYRHYAGWQDIDRAEYEREAAS